MLREALEYLCDLGRGNAGPQALILQDGTQIVSAPGLDHSVTIQPPKNYSTDSMRTIDSLLDWVKIHEQRGVDAKGEGVEIFLHPAGIDAFYARHEPHCDSAHLKFTPTAAWLALQRWIKEPHTQSQAIYQLRGPLANAAPGMVNLFRSIEFKAASQTSRDVSTGRDALGKSVRREALTGGQDFPEELTFDLPLYQGIPEPVCRITCAVEIVYESERIALVPVGDVIRAAEDQTLAYLAGQIAAAVDQESMLYQGTPQHEPPRF